MIMKKNKKRKVSRLLFALLFIYGSVLVFPRPQSVIGDNPLRKAADAKPMIIAHGGGNKEFPDNTLEAFFHAINFGGDDVMLETDVNLTKDGVIILSHDRSLDRKTTLRNADIIDVNYQDLIDDEIDFGYENRIGGPNLYKVDDELIRFRNFRLETVTPEDVNYPIDLVESGLFPRHPEKFLVSTLEELITLFPNNLINVEIKQTGDIGLAALTEVITLMDEYATSHQTYQRIVLASFHAVVYQQLLALKNTTHPQLMFSPEMSGVIKFYALQLTGTSAFYFDQVSVLQLPVSQFGLSLSTASIIRTAHLHNIAVHYWTINDIDIMVELIDKGVDGIMTDLPSVLYSVLYPN